MASGSLVHAAENLQTQQLSPKPTQGPVLHAANQGDRDLETGGSPTIDYAARANWLPAAVLGASDGLVYVTSLMIGVGAVSQTSKAMVVSALAGLIAGACSMAIGEFLSAYAQHDIKMAQIERKEAEGMGKGEEKENLPSPVKAAGASALAFGLGGLVPLLTGVFSFSGRMYDNWTKINFAFKSLDLGLN